MTSTTLAAALTVESRSVTLAGGTLTVGSLIAVDSEYLRVLEVYSATMGRVQRGVNGSSAAAHDNGADAIIGTPYEFLTGPAIPPPFGPSDDTLTAQGPSAAPSYAAGGGGASILHQATVTLTNAQVIALPTVPIEFVAAPGANMLLIPVQLVMRQSFGTAYGNVDAAARIYLAIGEQTGSDAIAVATTFTSTTARLAIAGAPNIDATLVDTSVVYPVTNVINQALNIVGYNAEAGNFTLGAGGNTLPMSVTYLILDTSTGQFE